jgi:hypothetical protein
MTKDVEALISRLDVLRAYLKMDYWHDSEVIDIDDAKAALSSLSLRVEELEKALEPFAERATKAEKNYGYLVNLSDSVPFAMPLGDFRRARAELTRLRTAAVDNDSVRGREGE